MARVPGATATLLQALDLYLDGPTEVTLVGDPPEAWLEALGRRYEPNLVLTRIEAPRDDRRLGREGRRNWPGRLRLPQLRLLAAGHHMGGVGPPPGGSVMATAWDAFLRRPPT